MPMLTNAEILDLSTMTTVLNQILNVFELGAGRLNAGGIGLLSSLIAIEITWAGLMWAFSDAISVSRDFLKKLMFTGVFAFIVLNWVTVANSILDGFVWAGMKVGGSSQSISLMRDPSRIIKQGFLSTANIWGQVPDLTIMSSDALNVMLMAIVCLVAMVMYFLIAINVFMTLLEFYIITSFGVIFIPWGVNNHTKWIAERYFGAIVAQGTKIMVLTALMGVIRPILLGLTLPADPTFQQVLTLAFGVATITIVVFRAPSVAGGLMSGAASLHAGDILAPATAGAGMGAAAGVAGAQAAATGGATLVKSGAKLAAKAGSALKNMGDSTGLGK